MRLPAPIHSFASDNVAGAHPAVLEAIMAANTGSAAPYGADPWTARAVDRVRELFGALEQDSARRGQPHSARAAQEKLAP